jgi:hypothetical protein
MQPRGRKGDPERMNEIKAAEGRIGAGLRMETTQAGGLAVIGPGELKIRSSFQLDKVILFSISLELLAQSSKGCRTEPISVGERALCRLCGGSSGVRGAVQLPHSGIRHSHGC